MPKILHGDTTAQQVFPLDNPYTQHNGVSQGICTAASLAWAKACLRMARGVNSWSEVGVSVHNLNIQMASIRKLDSSPRAQTEMAGLTPVGLDKVINNLGELFNHVKATGPHIGIFWNSYHTMGYRYSHHQKDFFDMNNGLYRAKYTEGIQNQIINFYQDAGVHKIIGLRIVKLPS
jgi:hypothetical protein